MNDSRICIADKIKQARESAGLTQAQLAKKIGTTSQNISQYERSVRTPKYETRKKIADALNINVQELMSSDELMSERFTTSLNRALEILRASADENNYLIAVYRSMNEVGRSKARALIEDLAKIPEYQESGQNSSHRAPLAPDETEGDPFEHPEPVESKAEE